VIQIYVFGGAEGQGPILDLAGNSLSKILKLFMYISNIAKTYICIENPEKNTGIFRCFFRKM